MNEADNIRAAVSRIGLREFARRAGCSPGAVQRLVKRGVYPVRGPHGPAMRALVGEVAGGGGEAAPASAPVNGAAAGGLGLRLVPAPGWEGAPAKPRRRAEAADRPAVRDEGDEGGGGESVEAANRRYAIARANNEEMKLHVAARVEAEARGKLLPAAVFSPLFVMVANHIRQSAEQCRRHVEAYAPGDVGRAVGEIVMSVCCEGLGQRSYDDLTHFIRNFDSDEAGRRALREAAAPLRALERGGEGTDAPHG